MEEFFRKLQLQMIPLESSNKQDSPSIYPSQMISILQSNQQDSPSDKIISGVKKVSSFSVHVSSVSNQKDNQNTGLFPQIAQNYIERGKKNSILKYKMKRYGKKKICQSFSCSIDEESEYQLYPSNEQKKIEIYRQSVAFKQKENSQFQEGKKEHFFIAQSQLEQKRGFRQYNENEVKQNLSQINEEKETKQNHEYQVVVKMPPVRKQEAERNNQNKLSFQNQVLNINISWLSRSSSCFSSNSKSSKKSKSSKQSNLGIEYRPEQSNQSLLHAQFSLNDSLNSPQILCKKKRKTKPRNSHFYSVVEKPHKVFKSHPYLDRASRKSKRVTEFSAKIVAMGPNFHQKEQKENIGKRESHISNVSLLNRQKEMSLPRIKK